ncbi:S-layer homology domain-containing protein [Anaerocellum danielii]|uniref:S-layer homology domain-containing protein n=1 Tax=Anaerocellum danielii TaxID=1387557 RepID=A0ABZ0U1P3_9FIRM|nr:S-layer homology domain-containing protein [Caldicellulosiruptor danielii]WPX08533.1 S-layer homology domain-containing protein [Caldicellulosiruptor danielii]
MKKFKRLIAIVTVLLFALSIIAPAFAQDEATTEETGSVYDQAAKVLVEKGILKGDESGNLMLDKSLTRAEILAMIIRATGQEDVINDYKDVEPSFTDVSKDHWAFAYVEAGKDLGYVNGYPDGTFKPDKPVKFEELAKMLVAAKGESPAAGKWPLNYVRKALDLGLFNGIEDEVGIGDVVIRGQAAVAFANAFFQPEKTIVVKDVKAVANDTIEVYVDAYLGNETATLEDGDVIPLDFEIKDASDPSKTIAVTLIDTQASDFGAGKLVLKTQAQTPNATYKVFYKGQDTGKTFVGVPANLQVTKVATDNLKTITVTFNDELDTNTVTASAFKVNDSTSGFAVGYTADKKSAVIILDTPVSQFASVKVTVLANTIKSKYGKALASDYSASITVQDTKQPTVTKVEALKQNIINITFSEPVIPPSTAGYLTWLKVDGINQVANSVTADYVNNALKVVLTNALSAGNHKVEVTTEVKDFAGYNTVAFSGDVAVTADTTAPQLKDVKLVYTDNSKAVVQLIFDEDIGSVSSVKVNGNSATLSISGSTVTATVNISLGLVGVVTIDYTVADLAGNTASVTGVAKTLTLDTSAVTITGTSYDSNNNITVTLSKPIYNKDGNAAVKINGTSVSYTVDTANNKIVIPAASYSGSCTVVLTGFYEATPLQLKVADLSFTVTLPDIMRPTVKATAYDIVAANVYNVYVVFSESMDTTSLSKASNYIVNGNNPTSITVVSDKIVKLTFSSDVTGQNLVVYGVKDLAGNEIILTSQPLNTAVQNLFITDVKFTASNQIAVTFNQGIYSIAPNAFYVTNGTSNYYFSSASYSVGDTTVTFTLANLSVPSNVGGTYTLVATGTTIKSIYERTLTTSGTAFSPIGDGIAPTVSSVTGGVGTITIAFSEAVNIADINAAVTVKDSAGNVITTATKTAITSGSNTVGILITGLAKGSYTVTVSASQVKDISPAQNAMSADYTSGTISVQ